jgi:hypothetical protein
MSAFHRRALLAIAVVCLAWGCTGSNAGSTERQPGGTNEPLFSQNFLALERGADGTSWRWMAEEGTIELPNTKRDMHLTIVGRVPSEISAPPTITLQLNGTPLDRVDDARGEIRREYDVPAVRLGAAPTATLRLTSNKTFTPKDLNPQSPDVRRLSFALYDLQWTPR